MVLALVRRFLWFCEQSRLLADFTSLSFFNGVISFRNFPQITTKKFPHFADSNIFCRTSVRLVWAPASELYKTTRKYIVLLEISCWKQIGSILSINKHVREFLISTLFPPFTLPFSYKAPLDPLSHVIYGRPASCEVRGILFRKFTWRDTLTRMIAVFRMYSWSLENPCV